MGSGFSTFVSVLRHEGPRAMLDRVADRREGQRRLRRLPRVVDHLSRCELEDEPGPVVNLSPVPPYPRRGGAQLQLLDRLEEEANHRRVAHLYPTRKNWHLECWGRERRELRIIGVPRDDQAASQADILRAVATAARVTETEVIHIENLYGLPLELVPRLQKDGYRVILSVHDFTLFCRRPHLIAKPGEQFCGFETNAQRCGECLAADWLIEPGMLISHRSKGASALGAAERVVFPSATHRDRHLTLFPDSLDAVRTTVINPATSSSRFPRGPAGSKPDLAVVGGLKHHKGGALVGEVLESVRETVPGISCTVFGDCDPELVPPLRRLRNVTIRGYYRSGRLPELLAASGASVALFPSVAAESYALVVDECLHAGVPVVAFDTGEVGRRLRELNAGIVVDRTEGPQGLARAILRAVEDNLTVPEGVSAALPTPAKVARQYLDLYDNLVQKTSD